VVLRLFIRQVPLSWRQRVFSPPGPFLFQSSWPDAHAVFPSFGRRLLADFFCLSVRPVLFKHTSFPPSVPATRSLDFASFNPLVWIWLRFGVSPAPHGKVAFSSVLGHCVRHESFSAGSFYTTFSSGRFIRSLAPVLLDEASPFCFPLRGSVGRRPRLSYCHHLTVAVLLHQSSPADATVPHVGPLSRDFGPFPK